MWSSTPPTSPTPPSRSWRATCTTRRSRPRRACTCTAHGRDAAPSPSPKHSPTRILAPRHVEAAAWVTEPTLPQFASHARTRRAPHEVVVLTLTTHLLTRWSRRDCTRSLTRCAQICAWRSMPSRRRRGRLVSCMLFEDACAQGTWAAPPAVLECAGLASLLIGGRWWKDSVDRYG